MNSLKKTLLSLLPSLISLALAVGTATLFSACGQKEDGTWMRCHGVQVNVVRISAILSAVLLLPVLIRRRWVRIAVFAAAAACGILLFLLPEVLMPMCMMRTMRCYTFLQPFVRIQSAALVAVCVFRLIRAIRERKA